jgi:hypothetical protein
MTAALPRVTSDRVCCPCCGLRAPFLPTGLTDWHTDGAGRLCDGVFPPYVIARDPKTKSRPAVAGHGIPGRARARRS